MLAALQKKYANYVLRPYLERYLRKPRVYRYNKLELKVYPGVFHPKYFFSTQLLLEFLDGLTVKNKSFCEVGAGSGLISFTAFQMGARVTALEINETAVKGLQENLAQNFSSREGFTIIQSDLFKSVPSQKFDILMINPPYFFKSVKDESSLAWNCGENGEYFIQMFDALPRFCHDQSEIYMILAENCEIERIRQLADDRNFNMSLQLEKKIKWEKNFIFKLNFRTLANLRPNI